MKTDRSFVQHLVLNQIVLLPGGEWTPRLPGWTFLYPGRGVGYWVHPQLNYELAAGSVLVLPHQAQGFIRSSQLGEMAMDYFCVQPEKLAGIITLAEQKVLQEEARKGGLSIRHFPQAHSIAEQFRRLREHGNETGIRVRLLMLQLFLEAFERELEAKLPAIPPNEGAKTRLQMLLGQMRPADMLDVNFSILAAKVGCTPRHLGRLFQEVVGVSFRKKQAEVRLGKAQELLATTKSKVVEVALESGYQSLSLFNFMFKRRFGVTPAQWRERPAGRKVLG